MTNFTAIIPVRCGSKSIPMKNIKPFLGQPLVYWTLKAACAVEDIDEVIVSTDCVEIAKVVKDFNNKKIKVIMRSERNSSDEATTESVIREVLPEIKNEAIILLQATSPLTRTEDIEKATSTYINSQKDVISVVREHRFYWKESNGSIVPTNYELISRPRRQDFSGTLVENGAFYITSKNKFLKSGVRVSGEITYIEMPSYTSYEIDDENDWIILENVAKQINQKKKNIFDGIKMFATDCDGVLTDAGMYYTADGDSMKKFNTKDGMAVSLLQEQGIIVAILTGENSLIVQRRAEKLNIEDVFLGCKNKVKAMDQLLEKYQLNYENVAYIGDDLNDVDLLSKVGLSFTVSDGVDDVKKIVDYVTKAAGGDGAFREASDYILKGSKKNV